MRGRRPKRCSLVRSRRSGSHSKWDVRKSPYSPLAKNALVQARKEMRCLGDDYLGTEHVLLGIVGDEDGMAARILASMGVSPETLEDRLFELRGHEVG